MTGEAIERPTKTCRLHVCVTNPCAARYSATKYGMKAPPLHVRFLAWEQHGAASAAEEATPPVGGSHVAAGAQGNEIEAAGAEAISEVHNMLPDAHSEETSAVAELSSEFCKSATDAQPEEKPAVAGLSSEVNSVSAEVHCDDIEAAVAAASPHDIVEHGIDVGVEAEALYMMGAPAKQELIPVDLGAVASPPAPRVVTAQLIEPPPVPPPRLP